MKKTTNLHVHNLRVDFIKTNEKISTIHATNSIQDMEELKELMSISSLFGL